MFKLFTKQPNKFQECSYSITKVSVRLSSKWSILDRTMDVKLSSLKYLQFIIVALIAAKLWEERKAVD